jgi:sulfide dehydrogenase [flavocytochrome c] flavoprotein subunit
VAVVGGGFAGATCAKYLRRVAPEVSVTLVEPAALYHTCPMSNWVIAGLWQPQALEVNEGGLERHGVKLVRDRVSGIDASRKQVQLAGGDTLKYDRLVVAPGIEFKWGHPEGYDQAAAERMPHAWQGGPQTELLHRQLLAMDDGGVFAIAVPRAPFRCPPGPYERASLVADYLKAHKPRSKVLILDANDKFAKQALFEEGWKKFYPGMIQWVPVTEDGAVRRVDPKTMTLYTDVDEHKVAVANVIPSQSAGAIALKAGLGDASGWCPIDFKSFESPQVPNVHVIGDAALASPMPKSASAANSEAKICALAVASLLRGQPVGEPSFVNTCYSLVAPDYAISINDIFRLSNGVPHLVEGSGGTSPLNASAAFRAREALYDEGWYASIVADSFT